MKNVKVVIGANFGDEGKGLMTDYFCSLAPEHERVLNVRFNGGAQAGHTVVTPDGRRHVFSHFGSGSFLPNVATYFGPDFIVNPILFRKEYEQLMALGVYPMVYCHPKCIFTMPQDMMVNQFIERRRGNERHGSCGVGIFETEMRNRRLTRLEIGDFQSLNPNWLIDISYYSFERVQKMVGFTLTDHEKALMNNQNIRAHYNQDLKFFMDHVILHDESLFKPYNYIVFEGAQGLMLDQNNLEYFPHLTPSNTGIDNVLPFLEEDIDAEICYVTRPYLTRHGNGRLDGEHTREQLGLKIDITNQENEWQGKLRYAPLDWEGMKERCIKDWQKSGSKAFMSMALTHADDPPYRVLEMTDFISNEATYISSGPTRNNVVDCGSFARFVEKTLKTRTENMDNNERTD